MISVELTHDAYANLIDFLDEFEEEIAEDRYNLGELLQVFRDIKHREPKGRFLRR